MYPTRKSVNKNISYKYFIILSIERLQHKMYVKTHYSHYLQIVPNYCAIFRPYTQLSNKSKALD